MLDIKALIEQEITSLKLTLEHQAGDPVEKAALAQMVHDLSMLPIWMAEGQDVGLLLANLKAETAIRSALFTIKVQSSVKQAWANILTKIIGTAIGAALA
jgi:hypothetical protein